MTQTLIQVELLSGTSVSRGEGTPGRVDIEVDHDELGLPIIRGRILRGLLRDTWLAMEKRFPELEVAGVAVFGPSADVCETAILRVENAYVPSKVRDWVRWAVEREIDPLDPYEVLESLTVVRTQTSEDRATGASERTTLRMTRVVSRGQILVSASTWLKSPSPEHTRCLALSLLGTRHLGMARTRGRGYVRMTLDGNLEATRQAACGGPS